jgi:hypothetical protein
MSISPDNVLGSPEQGDEYEDMIETLDEIIDLGLYKVSADRDGRVSSNHDKEKCRTEYMNRVTQAIRVKRQVVKDRHLQEMGKTLEAMKESDDFDL